jgi:queuine/archaeosine tRNA-ribosyltransferase
MLYPRAGASQLLTEPSLAYYQDFVEDMRRAIAVGSFDGFCDAAKTAWWTGETSGKLERDGQGVLA